MVGIRFQVIETSIGLHSSENLSVRKLNVKTSTVNYITQYLGVLKLFVRMNHLYQNVISFLMREMCNKNLLKRFDYRSD